MARPQPQPSKTKTHKSVQGPPITLRTIAETSSQVGVLHTRASIMMPEHSAKDTFGFFYPSAALFKFLLRIGNYAVD